MPKVAACMAPLWLCAAGLVTAQLIPMETGGVSAFLSSQKGTLSLIRDSHDSSAFSFTPNGSGSAPSYHQFGDVTLRVRIHGSGSPYTIASTATSTQDPNVVNGSFPGSLHAFDLTVQLDLPGLGVVREYARAPDGLGFLLVYTLTNGMPSTFEIGGFGFSLVTYNDWTGKTLEENAAQCSLVDPSITSDGGFVKVTRISGSGAIMLVAPHAETSCNETLVGPVAACGAPLEAWRPLHEDPTPTGTTFEGYYEYTILSAAYAENEWQAAQPWNPPTSLVLRPGEKAVFSVRIWTEPEGQEASEASLLKAGVPLFRAYPGYVLSADTAKAQLLLAVPSGYVVAAVTSSPVGAITVSPGTPTGTVPWVSFPVAVGPGSPTGRATLTFSLQHAVTGRTLAVRAHYFLTPPLPALLATYSHHAANRVWFNDTTDAFARAFSMMGYDATPPGRVIRQEERVFAAGLSDEAGAGAGLAYATHAWKAGDALAATLMATYVNRTLAGQKRDGAGVLQSIQQPQSMGVRAAMFWGTVSDRMPGFNYTVCQEAQTPWYCWDEARGEALWRSYNYPHPAAVYFALYRLSRDMDQLPAISAAISAGRRDADPLSTDWGFYLNRSAWTLLGMDALGQYNQYGLMVGPVYAQILSALQEEASIEPGQWEALAQEAGAVQLKRTKVFVSNSFPFGSEMPWDSTGQAEIYVFSQRYGAELAPESYRTSNLTLAATKAYTPWEAAHWAYAGSSRRYWDFSINGGWPTIRWNTERALHHYGSGINSEVLLEAFRAFPNDTVALRAGFAATMGSLTQINALTGETSMGLHGDPSLLLSDAYSADYGIGSYGAAAGFGCFVVEDDLLQSTVGYGCDAEVNKTTGVVTLTPRDPYHTAVYVQRLGLAIQMRSAAVGAIVLDPAARTFSVVFDHGFAARSNAPPPLPLPPLAGSQRSLQPSCKGAYSATRMRISDPTTPSQRRIAAWTWVDPAVPPPLVRGAFELPCDVASVTLSYELV